MGADGIKPTIPVQKIIHKIINIQLDRNECFQDDYITGKVILNPFTSLLIQDISLKLMVNESWIYTASESNVRNEKLNTPVIDKRIGIGNLLNINTNLINLQPGTFTFPFTLKVPPLVNPSFEFPLPQRRAYIRYNLIAQIISSYAQGEASQPILILARPKSTAGPLNFKSMGGVKVMGLFDKGQCGIDVSYPSNNCKVGSKVRVSVGVNNSGCNLEVSKVKIVLNRKVSFHERDGSVKFQNEKKLFTENFPLNVQAKQTRNFSFSIPLSDTQLKDYNYSEVFNPYNGRIDLNTLMPSCDGPLVKCEYYLRATLYFSSMVSYSYRPRVILPLFLSHQLENEYLAEKDSRSREETILISQSQRAQQLSQPQILNQSYQQQPQNLNNNMLMRSNTYQLSNNSNINYNNGYRNMSLINTVQQTNVNQSYSNNVQMNQEINNSIAHGSTSQILNNNNNAMSNSTNVYMNQNNGLQRGKTYNPYVPVSNSQVNPIYNLDNLNNDNCYPDPPSEDESAPPTGW